MICVDCGKPVELSSGEKVGFKQDCPHCSADLHNCLNCNFYDATKQWECAETIQERVADKQKANYCEYYAPAEGKTSGAPQKKNDHLAAAEALFKKK